MLQRLLLLHPGLTMKVQSHVRSFWMPAAGSRDLCFSLAHSDISTLHSTFPTKLKKPFSLLTPSIPLHAYSTAELLTVRACMADTNTHTHTQTHTHTPHQFTHAPLCLGALMWLTLLPTPLAGSIQCQRHLPWLFSFHTPHPGLGISTLRFPVPRIPSLSHTKFNVHGIKALRGLSRVSWPRLLPII